MNVRLGPSHKPKPRIPTEAESLARIAVALERIAVALEPQIVGPRVAPQWVTDVLREADELDALNEFPSTLDNASNVPSKCSVCGIKGNYNCSAIRCPGRRKTA